ncbi:MAG: two component transcriptional regulator, winged helix family [Phycisphaerales bacterium]|jgi:DNA-binding response OmpR family regulator|nr:two component transcriptional regulator, winged helix family [Phycisphaerales bacterium]
MPHGNGEPQAKREILVVEDDPEINGLVGAYVEIAGFRYRAALSGADALSEINRHIPSLIVLDLMLPDFSGWEVCRRVKHANGAHQIPVIILTALDNEESRRQGVQCGVSDYLTKPFDPNRLLDALTKHANGRNGGHAEKPGAREKEPEARSQKPE